MHRAKAVCPVICICVFVSMCTSYHMMCVSSDLSAEEQSLVVELLVASVRQAVEGPLLAGRSTCKKVSVLERLKRNYHYHPFSLMYGLIYSPTRI